MIIDGIELSVTGRIFRSARLRAEYYEFIQDPAAFTKKLCERGARIDLLSFLPEIDDRVPRASYHYEWDSISVLPLTTFENWWKSQISGKERNMSRKAGKMGVDVRVAPFDDEFVRGIKGIYDEAPVRQGKKFWHYNKDLETLRKGHVTFVDRSEFIGAYLNGEMIGFIKLVYGRGTANLMQILSRMEHRDKAPTDALLAKAVELCTARGIPNLHYGMWSRRGLGAFKVAHGFQRVDVPRYYIPLTFKGKLMLACKLHHQPAKYLPDNLVDRLTDLRARWLSIKYKKRKA